MGNKKSAWIDATKYLQEQMMKKIARQMEFDLFNRRIDIKRWYGSNRRFVIRYRQNYEDKGTVLINWVK